MLQRKCHASSSWRQECPNTHIRFQTQQNSCTEKEGHRRRLTNKTFNFSFRLQILSLTFYSRSGATLARFLRRLGSAFVGHVSVSRLQSQLSRKNLAVDCIFQSNFLDINWAGGEWIHNTCIFSTFYIASLKVIKCHTHVSKQCILSCGQSYMYESKREEAKRFQSFTLSHLLVLWIEWFVPVS